MTDEQFIATAGGGILYDASRVSKPGAELFSRAQWRARGALEEVAGGRSSIAVLNVSVWPGVEPPVNPGHSMPSEAAEDSQPAAAVDSQQPKPAADSSRPESTADSLRPAAADDLSRIEAASSSSGSGGTRWVLRHYRRGGFIARLSRDRYFWTGARRTRSFAEFRLLAELRRRGLPVPAPIAAHYVRGLLSYRADLITEQLPGARTLSDVITGCDLPEAGWVAVGRTVAAFHREGVHHADLNANNILLGSNGVDVYLLDFDRGRIEARGAWEQVVVARLRRSLEKIKGQRDDVRFGEREWQWLHSALIG